MMYGKRSGKGLIESGDGGSGGDGSAGGGGKKKFRGVDRKW